MSFVLAFNPLSTPVTADDGRVVGAGEWECVDDTGPVVAELVTAHRLRLLPDPAEAAEMDPRAAAAWARVQDARAGATADSATGPRRRGRAAETSEG
ncbi:hypothetical protein DQ384_36565 [Sphaerisporangium album]|uniref:Uncharacterized protein n=1 Tax=Sphaerisporangium album TaxID=509200 RepID=A0A367ETW7_9ACTN|nr:hypothetical protein [Sphaerisporangium album]RCG21132.1 hypothetical protein DQ384_36565 [Sphaerisporangium album]